jgi:hypothetical protein
MEYFIGSALTLITVMSCNIMLRKNKNKTIKLGIQFSQSRLHELLRPLEILENLVRNISKSQPPTQSREHYSGQHVKVIMSETEAYWIANNKFYVADVVNSLIVQETTREVDTMVMDAVQLKKIIEIVEMLGDGDDSGSSGNKRIR